MAFRTAVVMPAGLFKIYGITGFAAACSLPWRRVFSLGIFILQS